MTTTKYKWFVLLAVLIVGGFVLTDELLSQNNSEPPSSIARVPGMSLAIGSSTSIKTASEGFGITKDSARYLRSLDGSQQYELDLNPSGTLSDDDLSKAMHERKVVLRQLDPATGIYQIIGPIDLSKISRVTAMFEDPVHSRVFLEEFVGKLYYRLRAIDTKHLRVVASLPISTQQPEVPLVVSPDGNLMYVSWQSDNADQGGPAWQTAAIDTRNYKISQTSSDFTVRLARFGGLESSEFSEDGKQLFTYKLSTNAALNDTADTLLVVEASTSRITGTVSYSDMAPGRLTVRGLRNGKVVATEELPQAQGSIQPVFGITYDLDAHKLVRRTLLDGYAEGWCLVDATGDRLVVDVWKENSDKGLIPAGVLNIFDLQNGRSSKLSISGTVLLSSPELEAVYLENEDHLFKVDFKAAAVTEQTPLTRQSGGIAPN